MKIKVLKHMRCGKMCDYYFLRRGTLRVPPSTSSRSQVRFHLTFMNIRPAICAGLVTINGYIMCQNKRAFLWREEPTWGEKSTSWATERAGVLMPKWRRKDGGNVAHTQRHTLLRQYDLRFYSPRKGWPWICFSWLLTLKVWVRPPSGLKGGPQGS